MQRIRLTDLAQQGPEQGFAGGVRPAELEELAAELGCDVEQRAERPRVNSPSQAPQYQLAPGAFRCSCSTSADLPTPASPATSTSLPWAFRASPA